MWIRASYQRNYSLLIWYWHQLAAKMHEVLGEMSGKHSMPWIQLLPRIGKPNHKLDFLLEYMYIGAPYFTQLWKRDLIWKKKADKLHEYIIIFKHLKRNHYEMFLYSAGVFLFIGITVFAVMLDANIWYCHVSQGFLRFTTFSVRNKPTTHGLWRSAVRIEWYNLMKSSSSIEGESPNKFQNWSYLTYSRRRFMAEILLIRRKTLFNQSIHGGCIDC